MLQATCIILLVKNVLTSYHKNNVKCFIKPRSHAEQLMTRMDDE